MEERTKSGGRSTWAGRRTFQQQGKWQVNKWHVIAVVGASALACRPTTAGVARPRRRHAHDRNRCTSAAPSPQTRPSPSGGDGVPLLPRFAAGGKYLSCLTCARGGVVRAVRARRGGVESASLFADRRDGRPMLGKATEGEGSSAACRRSVGRRSHEGRRGSRSHTRGGAWGGFFRARAVVVEWPRGESGAAGDRGARVRDGVAGAPSPSASDAHRRSHGGAALVVVRSRHVARSRRVADAVAVASRSVASRRVASRLVARRVDASLDLSPSPRALLTFLSFGATTKRQ